MRAGRVPRGCWEPGRLILELFSLGEAGVMKIANKSKNDRPVNMLATLEMIKNKYGGAEGYLKQKCGFDDQDLERIRKNVIESRHTAK